MAFQEPPEAVFDFMADVENERDWNADLIWVRRLGGEGPVGLGSEWEGRYRRMGTMRVRLEEYERPHRLTFSTVGDRLAMRLTFDFTPSRNGTDVAAAAEVTPKGPIRWFAPLMAPVMRRTMFGDRPKQLEEGMKRRRTG